MSRTVSQLIPVFLLFSFSWAEEGQRRVFLLLRLPLSLGATSSHINSSLPPSLTGLIDIMTALPQNADKKFHMTHCEKLVFMVCHPDQVQAITGATHSLQGESCMSHAGDRPTPRGRRPSVASLSVTGPDHSPWRPL
jgi:hypothetical protein